MVSRAINLDFHREARRALEGLVVMVEGLMQRNKDGRYRISPVKGIPPRMENKRLSKDDGHGRERGCGPGTKQTFMQCV